MRILIAALFLAFSSISSAMALSGATADSADRFPFVVEIKYQDRLTVLFPRIVVTAAHCVQEKVHFRGGEFYADSYFLSADLTVTVTHHGGSETHPVADVAASPVWRALETDSSSQRFAHDLALIVTKEPIDVGLPPSFDKLADDETAGPQIVSVRPSDAAVTPRYEALRGVLETGLTHRGVLVAFGADKCSSLRQCGDAGIRRYLPISIKASADCFNDSRGRPRYRPYRLSLPPCCRLPCGAWNRASCPATAGERFWSRGRKDSSIISASSPRNRGCSLKSPRALPRGVAWQRPSIRASASSPTGRALSVMCPKAAKRCLFAPAACPSSAPCRR